VNKELLKKYFDGKCNPVEADRVRQWINSPKALDELNKNLFNDWRTLQADLAEKEDWSEVLAKIDDRIRMEELFKTLDSHTDPLKDKKGNSPKKGLNRGPVKRGQIKVLLPVLFGLLLIISLGVAFMQNDTKAPEEIVVTEIVKQTEKGQKLTVKLRDGSKVILNANSKITYNTDYGLNDRKVSLEGEAYFEVAEDSERPFRVTTGQTTTTALGTSFNISSIPESDEVRIALVTGKVSVVNDNQSELSNSIILMPGEIATFEKQFNTLHKSTFNSDEVIAWKNGVLYFKDANYNEMVRILENWYGVSIQHNKMPDPDWKFCGRFENESLENVMEALKFGHKFNYEIEEKDVQLKF